MGGRRSFCGSSRWLIRIWAGKEISWLSKVRLQTFFCQVCLLCPNSQIEILDLSRVYFSGKVMVLGLDCTNVDSILGTLRDICPDCWSMVGREPVAAAKLYIDLYTRFPQTDVFKWFWKLSRLTLKFGSTQHYMCYFACCSKNGSYQIWSHVGNEKIEFAQDQMQDEQSCQRNWGSKRVTDSVRTTSHLLFLGRASGLS